MICKRIQLRFDALAAALLVAALLMPRIASAGIDGESNTDGVNPAAELYDIAETQRLQQVARQLDLNRFMTWSSSYGPNSLWGPRIGGPPIRQPIGYESKQVSPNRWIYRPVYDEEAPVEVIAAPPALPAPGTGAPPAAGPRLPAPSDARPGDPMPADAAPKLPMPSGPREF